jgi:hypothetical protein
MGLRFISKICANLTIREEPEMRSGYEKIAEDGATLSQFME